MSARIDDRAYFARHPERRFRVRPATAEEIADAAALGGERPTMISVEQVMPGVRIRRFLSEAA